MPNIASQATASQLSGSSSSTQGYSINLVNNGVAETYAHWVAWAVGCGIRLTFPAPVTINKVVVKTVESVDGYDFRRVKVLADSVVVAISDRDLHGVATPAILEFTPVTTTIVDVALTADSNQYIADIEVYSSPPPTPKVNIYNTNPTEGLADGELVSCSLSSAGGDGSNPIKVRTALAGQSVVQALAIRTLSGNTSGPVIISPAGTSANKWALSLNGVDWNSFGESLIIDAILSSVNTIFYLKCTAVTGEIIGSVDTSVKLRVDYEMAV